MRCVATRIICVGNRYHEPDAAGPRVHDVLRGRVLPDGVDVIDGGLRGLDLLRFVEGCARVVFVDAMRVPGASTGVYVLDPDDVAREAADKFDHGAGLGYLLQVIPVVCGPGAPELHVVGIQGNPDRTLVERAAAAAADIAAGVAAGDASGVPNRS